MVTKISLPLSLVCLNWCSDIGVDDSSFVLNYFITSFYIIPSVVMLATDNSVT